MKMYFSGLQFIERITQPTLSMIIKTDDDYFLDMYEISNYAEKFLFEDSRFVAGEIEVIRWKSYIDYINHEIMKCRNSNSGSSVIW